jgi:tetratricopeptide (TPR) repeat protein
VFAASMTLVAYLVPLLFILSAGLAGMRFLHDALLPRNQVLAGTAAVAVLAIALTLLVPLTVRMSSIIGADVAFHDRDWSVAEERFALFQRWGGRLNHRTSFEYAQTLVNLNRFAEAIPLDLYASRDPTGVVSTDASFFLGLSLYKTGRLAEAERVLTRVPSGYYWAPTAYHLIGRIEERRGNVERAIWCFQRSLHEDPDFAPSLYHLVRVSILTHNPDPARRAIQTSVAGHPQTANDRFIRFLTDSIARGAQLPDHDFF